MMLRNIQYDENLIQVDIFISIDLIKVMKVRKCAFTILVLAIIKNDCTKAAVQRVAKLSGLQIAVSDLGVMCKCEPTTQKKTFF